MAKYKLKITSIARKHLYKRITANGRTQTNMYRAESFTLSDLTINAKKFTVMEASSSRRYDGLLGMNILREFRFQINQEKSPLLISLRHKRRRAQTGKLSSQKVK
ncbi:MAG: hypothetical protein COA42_20755 [Alteromonadaceae bacterium]|nr:MAG: hypothetical protein COA42_20755 [Alteromonadaceae bacterium]